jgi:hypothetical protein
VTRRALLLVTATTVAQMACDSSTKPGSAIDHLEITITPVRASYPIPDTAYASVRAIARDGTWMPLGTTTWRSLTPDVASAGGGMIITRARGTAIIEVDVDGVTARAEVPVRGIRHLTNIFASETWASADTPHVVQGYLNVGKLGTPQDKDTVVLTVQPGATVRFRPGSGLMFAEFSPAALVIPASGDPVVMEGDSVARGSWVGLSFKGPGRSELRNLTLRHCGSAPRGGSTAPCLDVSGHFTGSAPSMLIDNVTVSDAHDGVSLSHWVTLASGSRALSILRTDGYTARISPQLVGTFPRGGQFADNADATLRITNGQVEQSAQWTAGGLPWRLTGGVVFTGTANPVLVLPAGLTIGSEPGGSLTFESGGLQAGTTGGSPVVLESTGSGWGGIRTAHGGESTLRNVQLRDCGFSAGACLDVDAFNETDAGILLEDVTIRGAASAGIRFGTWGHFRAGSHDITITQSGGVPIDLTPEGVTSIPPGYYTGNASDAIRVRGGLVWQSATWHDLGVPYLAPNGFSVSSISAPGPTLTLDPGVAVRMGLGTVFHVDIGALQAVGTSARPITFSSVTPGTPGSWMGIELASGGDASLRLEYVDLADAGAGPAGFSGALRLQVDPGGVLRNSIIRRSPSCGVVLLGGAWRDDYTAPAFGNTFVDVAGPARC